MSDYFRIAKEAAAKSLSKKRKVGAVVVLDTGGYTTGRNYNPLQAGKCEYTTENGKLETYSTVVHAEIDALDRAIDSSGLPEAIYVTHQPCSNCKAAILEAGIEENNIYIVPDFLKFDEGKLRYGLIPPSATKSLAEVLTYGAKKYKPNNWKNGEIDRYVDAAFRHWEAYRGGEFLDSESGLSHLSHLLTNIVFLIELDTRDNK